MRLLIRGNYLLVYCFTWNNFIVKNWNETDLYTANQYLFHVKHFLIEDIYAIQDYWRCTLACFTWNILLLFSRYPFSVSSSWDTTNHYLRIEDGVWFRRDCFTWNNFEWHKNTSIGSKCFGWWTEGESNSWPLQCECSALPTELSALKFCGIVSRETISLSWWRLFVIDLFHVKQFRGCASCDLNGLGLSWVGRPERNALCDRDCFTWNNRLWSSREDCFTWCLQEELNLYLGLRSPSFYPLNYGSVVKWFIGNYLLI